MKPKKVKFNDEPAFDHGSDDEEGDEDEESGSVSSDQEEQDESSDGGDRYKELVSVFLPSIILQ